MNIEFYVAYSKTGTNCFITARKVVDRPQRPDLNETVELDGLKFEVSRPRQGKSLRDGVKLLTNNIKFSSSPQQVLAFFHNLRSKGWQVEHEDRFIKRHNIAVAPPAPPSPVMVTPEQEQQLEQIVATTPPINAAEDQIKQALPQMQAAHAVKTATKPLPPLTERQQTILTHIKHWAASTTNGVYNVITLQENLQATGIKMSPAEIKRVTGALAKRQLITVDDAGNVVKVN